MFIRQYVEHNDRQTQKYIMK